MAGLKEIRRRIRSVENTSKITRAMKLVSAAKLRKAQEAVESSAEYAGGLVSLLDQILEESSSDGFSHPLTIPHQRIEHVRFVVIGGSKGLCGPFNSNLNKMALALQANLLKKHPGATFDAITLGRKPTEFFHRRQLPTVATYDDLPNDPNDWPLEEICLKLEQDYLNGVVDQVHIIYTRFKSAIVSSATNELILPLNPEQLERQVANTETGIVLFEPSAEQVFAALIPNLLRELIRQACLHSVASEHGSRMSAMDAATKNAGELLEKLKRTRNRLRQASITSEILDIIGGAEAVS